MSDEEPGTGQNDEFSEVLEHLKETLQDLASGEVVGALWDEVRQVRASVESLVDRDAGATGPEMAETFRSEVAELTTSVRDLLEQAEIVDAPGTTEPIDVAPQPVDLTPLTERLDRLHDDIAGLRDRPASDELVETLSTELTALRRRIRLRAEGEIFSDEQLQVIADAVARKLRDRPSA